VATRLALIADSYLSAEGEVPPACAELIADADLVLHAGDVSSAAALARIEAIGPPVSAVQGNVEDAALRRSLPVELRMRVEEVRIAIVHDAGPATGRLQRLRARFPRADLVVFGHSHMPLYEVEGAFQIFNPGSPTQRRRAPHRSAGVAEISGGEIRLEHIAL
jgi:putative phosphoesterase